MKENIIQMRDKIAYILKTKEIDFDIDIIERESQRFYGEKGYIINSDSMKIHSEDYHIIFRKNGTMECLYEAINKVNNENKIIVIMVVNSIKEKQSLEKSYNRRVLVNEFNRKYSRKLKQEKIELDIFFISEVSSRKFDITIESRIKSIEMPWNEENTSGYVFSAKLYDIVEIYNTIGDKLFENNVRYEIKDELDVNKEITATLENRPGEFWFLNNGITMVIQDDNFNLLKSKSITLKYSTQNVVSVVNGAQTLTTAAKFFNQNIEDTDPESQKKKEIIENAIKDAKVILRIMNINKKKDDYKIISDRISIALNRQKSIKVEDIAYTYKFVNDINNLDSIEDKYYFELLKRGEEKTTLYSYDLIEFSRLAKSYISQLPGQGRSKSANVLLRGEYKDPEFILSDSMFKIIGESKEEFLKYYKPVNFGMKLLEQFDLYTIQGEKGQNYTAAIKYGRYYFVSFVIWTLISKNKDVYKKIEDNYSEFEVDYNKINENVNVLISKFAEAIESSLEELDVKNIESNDFKEEKLYDHIKSYIINDVKSKSGRKICKLFEEIQEFFK